MFQKLSSSYLKEKKSVGYNEVVNSLQNVNMHLLEADQ